MRLSARERQLLQVLAALLVIWLAIQIASWLWIAVAAVADVVLVFIVAWAFAYLIAPLVRWLDARTPLNRAGAVSLIYVVLAFLIAGILATVVPGLAAQLATLADRGPEYGQRAAALVTDAQATLKRAGIPGDLEQLYGSLPERIGVLASS